MALVPNVSRHAMQPYERELFSKLEEEIYQDSLEVIQGVQMFWKIFGDEASMLPDPPEEWVEEYGLEKANKFFKLAKAGLLNRVEVPMGVHVALAHAQSVVKAKQSKVEQHNQQLNIGQLNVQYPAPAALYPTREVDDE